MSPVYVAALNIGVFIMYVLVLFILSGSVVNEVTMWSSGQEFH